MSALREDTPALLSSVMHDAVRILRWRQASAVKAVDLDPDRHPPTREEDIAREIDSARVKDRGRRLDELMRRMVEDARCEQIAKASVLFGRDVVSMREVSECASRDEKSFGWMAAIVWVAEVERLAVEAEELSDGRRKRSLLRRLKTLLSDGPRVIALREALLHSCRGEITLAMLTLQWLVERAGREVSEKSTMAECLAHDVIDAETRAQWSGVDALAKAAGERLLEVLCRVWPRYRRDIEW